ncbi:hypothetical protein BDR22DRAFT_816476 [Usnea florida]
MSQTRKIKMEVVAEIRGLSRSSKGRVALVDMEKLKDDYVTLKTDKADEADENDLAGGWPSPTDEKEQNSGETEAEGKVAVDVPQRSRSRAPLASVPTGSHCFASYKHSELPNPRHSSPAVPRAVVFDFMGTKSKLMVVEAHGHQRPRRKVSTGPYRILRELEGYSPKLAVIIEGPSLPWMGSRSKEENEAAASDCKQQTIKMLYHLSQLKADKIHELIFFRVDMLPTNLAKQTHFRPFELQRVQFINCREYTMIDAAADLSEFKGFPENLVLTFTYKQPDFDVLKGKDTWGGVVSSLYYWRKHKVPLLHEHLAVTTSMSS